MTSRDLWRWLTDHGVPRTKTGSLLKLRGYIRAVSPYQSIKQKAIQRFLERLQRLEPPTKT